MGRRKKHRQQGSGLAAAVRCEAGAFRGNNEDAFYLNGRFKPLDKMDEPVLWTQEDHLPALYAVFDGMGGQAGGELAAACAAEGLHAAAKQILAHADDSKLALSCACSLSHDIRAQAVKLNNQMGATLVMAVLHVGGLEVYNLGDSRAYLLREGQLTQLSSDHTARQSMLNMGFQPPPPGHDYLTQYLGMDEEEYLPEPHHCHLEPEELPATRLMLCSDGVSGVLSEDEIARLLSGAPTPEDAVQSLVEAAYAAGSRDNATALVVGL